MGLKLMGWTCTQITVITTHLSLKTPSRFSCSKDSNSRCSMLLRLSSSSKTLEAIWIRFILSSSSSACISNSRCLLDSAISKCPRNCWTIRLLLSNSSRISSVDSMPLLSQPSRTGLTSSNKINSRFSKTRTAKLSSTRINHSSNNNK